MKGQIFIVVSIFFAIALLLIAMGTDVIPESPDYLQNYFVNLRTELTDTAGDAILSGEDISQALDVYILFSDDVLTKKGYTQDVTYVIAANDVAIDIYLEKNGEYYSDVIIIDRSVYT